MTRPQTLIFDFDGTIADTLHVAIAAFRKLAADEHATDDKEIERLRGMSARAVIKTLGIKWWRLPSLVYEGRKAVTEQIDHIKTFPGMAQVLRQLHDSGWKLFVLSSNSTKNIAAFLHNNKLENYFDSFRGDQGIFAKSAAIKKLMRTNNLKPEQCWYIGDEVRDVEAARHAGIRCISVSWGYNNRQALERVKAEIIVDQPAEILNIITKKAG